MTTDTGQCDAFDRVASLSNPELCAELERLVQNDRQLTAELLLHLGEMDVRRLHEATACGSLFRYCVEVFGFSEGMAFKRITAARLARRFPSVLELVRTGRLHLSGLLVVAPHLTSESQSELLALACGKTKREVEKLIAERFPRPDVPATIRKLPERRALVPEAETPAAICAPAAPVVQQPALRATAAAIETANAETVPETKAALVGGVAASMAAMSVRLAADSAASPALPWRAVARGASGAAERAAAGRIDPLASRRYRVTFTASQELCDKLERARELTSHAVAPGDLGALFERALDALIAREQKRRFACEASAPRSSAAAGRARSKGGANGETGAGRSDEVAVRSSGEGNEHAGRGPLAPGRAAGVDSRAAREGPETRRSGAVRTRPRSRHIPAEVRRAVWERDGGRCTFVDERGQRCSERRCVEFEHRLPFCRGGAATVENIRLMCSVHNGRAARVVLGERCVEEGIARSRRAGAVRPGDT
ncbi:MAG: HNH endonuclease [Polyangiaceae bacterium]|nr:HNH endonuclease [Polyangiaceae bacterium]